MRELWSFDSRKVAPPRSGAEAVKGAARHVERVGDAADMASVEGKRLECGSSQL